MSDIIKFLRHEDTDFKGRKLKELWALSPEEMENSHDVIQWMFPSDIPSKHHDQSPVLTDEQVNTMWRDPVIRDSIGTSCIVFSQFLSKTKPDWLTPRNHNFLRITRVLRCLWNMRMGEEYLRWRTFAHMVWDKNRDVVGAQTIGYWMHAHDDTFLKS